MKTQDHTSRDHSRRLLAAAGLAGVLAAASMAFPAARAQDVITYGAALSLTGKTAIEGSQVKDGYDFYVKHINEMGGFKVGDKTYKVAIKYYDDQSDPNTTVKLYEKLINDDGIKLLLGPYSSTNTFPASAVAEKYQVPMIEAHGAAPAIFNRGFKYIFATLNTAEQYTQNIIKMAAEEKPRAQRVAIIQENSLFMASAGDGAAAQAKAAGLDVVYHETYPSGTKDFSSMLAAVKSKNPDLLITAGYTGDMIVIARQVAEQGIKLKMFGMPLGPTLPGFVKSLGQKAEGLLEPTQWTPNMPWKDEIFGWTASEFAEIYKKEYGYTPDYHPPQSAAALEVYQRAIQKAGSLNPKKVRDAIAQTDMMTFYGPIRFNEKGMNIAKSMGVVQIQHGKPVAVYPPGASTGKLIYPLSQ